MPLPYFCWTTLGRTGSSSCLAYSVSHLLLFSVATPNSSARTWAGRGRRQPDQCSSPELPLPNGAQAAVHRDPADPSMEVVLRVCPGQTLHDIRRNLFDLRQLEFDFRYGSRMSLNVSRFQDAVYAPGSAGDIFRLIRSGEATSRSAIARRTGLAASTAGLRVDTLERLGLVTEQGQQESQGGRRARKLEVARAAGFVAAIDFGAHHLKFAVADLAGGIVAQKKLPVLVEESPDAVVEAMWTQLQNLMTHYELDSSKLWGIAVGLPAPIEYPSGRVVLPSFMPSWHNVSLPALFASYTDVPVLVENNANLVALAEASSNNGSAPDHILAVILGTRIGSGIITDGRLHRGFSGAAGEISHSAVDGESTTPCICGIPNCLESVASGGAIAAKLTAQGYEARSVSDVVALGSTTDPIVLNVLRVAGTQIGQVLALIVNFLNPHDVILSGAMSASAPLVAAIRAELFQRCLPIVANDLHVRAASDPENAGVRGAVRLILEEVLAAARVEQLARTLGGTDDDLMISSLRHRTASTH